MSRRFRVCSGSVLGVVLLLAGAMSANAAPASPSAATPAPCNTTGHSANGHFTLAEAQACSPHAELLPASAPLASDGSFIVPRGTGYQVISRSTKPIANRKGGDPCVYGTVTVIDGGGMVEWLGANLCWNYSVAWAYGQQSNCIFYLPGFFCLGRTDGTFGNYTRLAGAWGNFYGLMGIFTVGTGLRLDIQPNGHWWGWSYDCGRVC